MPQMQDEAGNIWEVDAQGNPIALVQQAGQGAGPPVDPSFQYEGPQAEADLARARAAANKTNIDAGRAQTLAGVDAATAGADIRKAEAEARIAEAQAAQAASGTAKATAASRATALKGFEDTRLLDAAIQEIESKYKAGAGQTTGLGGFMDYFPTAENKGLDDAGNSTRALVKGVLEFTGQENNTVRESEMNFGPYIPNASDWDENIEAKIDRLKRLRDSGYQRAVRNLGGVPNGTGEIIPVQDGVELSAENIAAIAQGQSQTELAGAGAEETVEPWPEDAQAEYGALMQRLLNEGGGRIDPAAAQQGIEDIAAKYDLTTTNASSFGAAANQYLEEGGTPEGLINNQQTVKKKLSRTEQALNDFGNSGFGAGVINAANMGGFGIPEALTGDTLAQVNEDNPTAAMIGQIGGSITGAGLVGAGGRAITKAVAPKVLNAGGRLGTVGRNVATDAAYSGIYGDVTGKDGLESALEGAIGSLGGQALGRGIGRGLKGVKGSDAVQELRERGVRMTGGRVLGDFARSVEDKAASIPIVGDVIRNRQREAMSDFNSAAFREAGAPVGFSSNAIGEAGVEQLDDAVSGAYRNATSGRNIEFDPQFTDDLAQIAPLRQSLPDDVGGRFDKLLNNHTQGTDITGDAYQRAMRGLTGARAKASTIAGEFDQPYREATSAGLNALEDLATRQGAPDMVSGLKAANRGNTNLNIIEDAVGRARNGGRSGDIDVFAPSQLNDAAHKARRYGGDTLRNLAKAGQEVLPSKIADSGTAGRLALGGGAVAALGVGEGLATEGAPDNTIAGAAALGLAAAAGSRRSQDLLVKALLDRPELLKQLGQQVTRRSGLFGSGAAGVTVAN